MVTTCRDEDGKIVAFIEWGEVAKSGMPKLDGEYVYVRHVWCHRTVPISVALKTLVPKMDRLASPNVKWVYFARQKYYGRVSKRYTREEFLRRFGHGRK